jgi:hypothetical protein
MVLSLGFLVVLILKLVYPFVLRFDSDEPQHLHVVWGWAHGLLQYRDVFDNHAPLFQILCAPLFRALGERADIVIPMRFAMIPLYCLTLWCVYQISKALYTQRTALWATLVTALVPVYFFTSSEFRTDDLWIVFWMLSLLFLLEDKSSRPLPFWTGFFMGCAFATSMKSSLLLGCLMAAGICVTAFKLMRGETVGWKAFLHRGAAGFVGVLIVPVLLILFFYFKGAAHDFYYCVIEHNVVPGMGNSKLGMHSLRLPIALPFLFGIGFAIFRYSEGSGIGARRALLFMTGGIYVMALRSYWPLITAQDYLPFVPLVCIVATPVFLWVGDRSRVAVIRVGIPSLSILALLWMTVAAHPFWKNDTLREIKIIQDVLNLTKPDESVMDGKGETIFRKRSFYYVLEGITIERMRRGLIANTIIDSLIETETGVVHVSRLQGAAIPFVHSNYLTVGKLNILGKMLNDSKQDSDAVYSFSVAVPSSYEIVGKEGPPSATLDGVPVNGPRRLAVGKHELRIAGSHGPIALFWARAVERGYSPFKSS